MNASPYDGVYGPPKTAQPIEAPAGRPEVLMLGNAMQFYVREHLIADGRTHKRMTTIAKHAFRIWGPEMDVTKFDRAATRFYISARESEGAKGATIRRELALVQACLNHNVREERIKGVVRFVKPRQSAPRMRWLTREEYRQLMLQPMPHRIRMFLLMAFGTGARSEAIQELTWDRINWTAQTIDFRVPGVIYRNKRRVVAPIGDALFRRLEAAYARPGRDDFVIGAGGNTYRKVKALMRAIGINETGIARHVARHTFSSWLIQAGASYAKIGVLIGDSALQIEKTYGHMAPEHTRDVVNLALLD